MDSSVKYFQSNCVQPGALPKRASFVAGGVTNKAGCVADGSTNGPGGIVNAGIEGQLLQLPHDGRRCLRRSLEVTNPPRSQLKNLLPGIKTQCRRHDMPLHQSCTIVILVGEHLIL
ncbi:unnamed protein product [Prunus armeniaca]|uniref:Uncharacterized protein n=1 Tax=Prunus armeniaca TaxID=36596 RepID=A0A6J5VI76_PRUAR|nr:unnamed protein product [Prunus armeniaca]